MLTLGVVDEELLVELGVGDVGKPFVVGLLHLLHPQLVKIIVAGTAKAKENEEPYQAQDALPNLPPGMSAFWFLFLFLLVGGSRGWFRGLLLWQGTFALRTLHLCHKAIAAAAGTSAQLAGNSYAAMRTGASHRGNLPPA